ncbi:YIP1 family protein [Aquicoccus sp. SCR17]|nr:YIP1 family protein [Carideicomes alvinocaridis]
MTGGDLGRLALMSVTEPRRAAQQLLALDLGAGARRDALLLVVSGSALLMGIAGLSTPDTSSLAFLTGNPVLFALFLGLGLVGMIQGSTLIGRAFGGRGALADLTVLLTWVQGLRLLAQVVMLLVAFLPAGPQLAAMLGVAASVIGLWISAVFIDEAHGFGNILKSFGVLLLAGLIVVLGLSLLWSLVGPINTGAYAHV